MIKLNRNFLAIILIIALGFFVYANSLHNGFVYDDELVAEGNSFLSSWGNLQHFFSPLYFSGSGEFTFRPILTLTYIFDYACGRGNAFAFHQTNLILHILNGLLFYFFLLLIIPCLDRKYNAKLMALIAALIFIAHPVQTESVNGISFREELLVALFSLSSIIFFIINKTKKNYFYLVLSLISYLCALFSKESALALIFIIFLIDLYYKKESEITKDDHPLRNLKISTYIGYISIILFFIGYSWMREGEKIASFGGVPYLGGSLYTALLTSCRVIMKYLSLLIFPAKLSIEYYNYYLVYPSNSISEPKTLASLAALILLAVFIIRNFWKYRLFAFSALWFFLWLAPASNIIPLRHPMAERFLYISTAGFSLFLSALIINPFYFKPQKLPIANIKKLQIFFLIILLSVYSMLTINRNKVWKDPFVFWKEATKQLPSSQRAYSNLGYAYYKNKMYNEAIAANEASLKLSPDYAPAYKNLSLVYFDLGDYDAAQRYAKEALRLEPLDPVNINQQGRIFLRKQQYALAKEEFKKVLQINPFHSPAYNNLAVCYFKESEYDQAIQAYNKVLQLNPSSASVYVNLGLAYAAKNDLSKAEEYFLKALKVDPSLVDAHHNLGAIYLMQGRNEQAKKEYKQILKIDPGNSKAKLNLDALK